MPGHVCKAGNRTSCIIIIIIIVNVNVTIKLGIWCPMPQKHFKLAVASCRAAFSGNTSVIATFSSLISF